MTKQYIDSTRAGMRRPGCGSSVYRHDMRTMYSTRIGDTKAVVRLGMFATGPAGQKIYLMMDRPDGSPCKGVMDRLESGTVC